MIDSEAAYSKEDEWKFLYVTKGPQKTRQKKLFYVFGKGFDSTGNGPSRQAQIDGGESVDNQTSHPTGQGYAWPPVFKQHAHIYLDLYFPHQGRA